MLVDWTLPEKASKVNYSVAQFEQDSMSEI